MLGRLKPGVTPQEAAGDLNALGAWLSKTYPTDDDGVKFTLARPGLVGDMLGGPARAFMAGLMLLAGLILLAACANLGSLFRRPGRGSRQRGGPAAGAGIAARAAFCGSCSPRRCYFACRRSDRAGRRHRHPAWPQRVAAHSRYPHQCAGESGYPHLRRGAPAVVLSGLLFGIVPVRQVMRADPWQMIRTGMSGTAGMKRFTLRDVLLVTQVAICAVLVTSSLVAVRGLVRSLHSSYGFVPENVMLLQSDLQMAGYTDARVPQMQRRMLDAVAAIPGVTSVGYVTNIPLGMGGGDSYVYTDATTDFRPTNYIADAMNYNISPGYLAAAGTRLLAGRDFTFHDDKPAPKVAIVNRQFAVKVFGSVDKAVGGHFKYWGGERAEVVGVVEDGKYRTLTEDQMPAMFFSFLKHESGGTWLVVRSKRDPQEIARALESTSMGWIPGFLS